MSKGCHFFPTSQKKRFSYAHCPYSIKKSVHSLKHTARKPTFDDMLSKTKCSHVSFFKCFMEKPQLSCPYLVKKASNVLRLDYIMG